MKDGAEKEARRALNRLKRAAEKAVREMDALEAAIRHAEGDDFPAARYDEMRERVQELTAFADEEAMRLQAKILMSGGLEPGRVRRSSS